MTLSSSSEEHIDRRSTLLPLYEDNHNHHHNTAKWNLIFSCFFTTFICAWAAIHPNAIILANPPGSKRLYRLYTFWTLLYERLVLVFIFIIFPEFILAWALVQRQVASYLTENPGWTQTHGFLAIMGGFHYYKSANLDTPCGPIKPGGLVQATGIELPTLEEIRDKSKSGESGEMVMKTLALSQMFWFLTQCIANSTTTTQISQEIRQRRVTKLELLTAAYIMMTLWMRWAWWNKPLNMTQPIRLFQFFEPIPESTRKQKQDTVHKLSPSAYIRQYHHRYVKAAEDMISGFSGDWTQFPDRKTVPRFYTGGKTSRISRSPTNFFIVLLLSIVFAAINCIAWSYDDNDTLPFIEIVLWRLSSLAGVGFWLIFVQSLVVVGSMESLGWIRANSFYSNALCVWVISLWALAYVLLRIASFILAIRELNTGASLILNAADWTYFIPHI